MNAADILKYGHMTLLGTIEDYPEAEWEAQGVCGVWSAKDVMAHLASYELLLAELLLPFAGGEGDTPTIDRFAEVGPVAFNDDQVDARKDKSIQEVLDEYKATYERVAKLAPQIAAETWREVGTLPWYGPEYSLDDFIVYTYYGHKREHAAQIAAFKDRLQTAV